MPNKNSIESEIDKILNENAKFDRAIDGSYIHAYFIDRANQQIKKLLQREVKKGRVEELEAIVKINDPNEIIDSYDALVAIESHTSHRLEELEG